MKKINMLKKNYEFKYVLNRGKYCPGKFIDIFILKNKFKINKIGIAVSKKTDKSVKRNRIKRLIRENFLKIEKSMLLGYNIVILCKKNTKIKQTSFQDIRKDMINIFFNQGLLKKEE